MRTIWFIFIEYRFSMAFLLVFQMFFLPLFYKLWKSIGIAAGCFLISGLIEYQLFFGNVNVGEKLILTLLEIIVVQMTAFLLSRYRDMRTLFTGISSAINVLPGNVFFMGMSAFYGPSLLLLAFTLLIHLSLLLAHIILLRANYMKIMENKFGVWSEGSLILALFYFVVYSMVCWSESIYGTNRGWITVWVLLILIEATYIFLLKTFSQQWIKISIRNNREILEVYTSGLRREMEVIKKSEEKMRMLKHDSRYIYQIMQVYLKDGRTEELKELLEQLNEKCQSLVTKRYCDNIVINGILSGFDEKFKKEKVEFKCCVDIPKEMKSVNEFELATVISNLLENAVQAAKEIKNEKERKVMLRIFSVKGQLILEIKNTFDGVCELIDDTGLPISSKGENHGYGLRSVKAYAEKNHAIFGYSVESGMFCVRLLTDL